MPNQKRMKYLAIIRISEKKINEKGVLSNSISLPDPFSTLFHLMPRSRTLTCWNISSDLLCSSSWGGPGNFGGRDENMVKALTLIPFLWSHFSLAVPLEKMALLDSKWPILHNSFWFWKPLLLHITIIRRESNICFCYQGSGILHQSLCYSKTPAIFF